MAQEIGVRERLAGEVAGQGKLPSSRLRPRLQLAAGVPEYEKVVLGDGAGLDHQVDIFGRLQQPVLRILPAGHGLRPHDRAAAV